MWQSDAVGMLQCPEEGTPLSLADAELVKRLNTAIRAGVLRNRTGSVVTDELDGALVRADAAVAYPIIDGIPVLISDDAIPLDQLHD